MSRRIVLIGMAAAVLVSGCVSSGTFKKMETAKNDEIAALQKEMADLEEKKKSLEENVSALERDAKNMTERIGSLSEEKASIEEEVGSLEQEKAALLSAGRQQQQQYEQLVHGLAREVEKGQLQVRQYKNMLSVDLAEQIFFDSGRAALKSGGKEVLKTVAGALKGYEDKVIRVVGHTDNVPVARSLRAIFPTNWELSVARATNVVRFLQDAGIPPERLVPSGRGEYDPVAPNDTPEGRQKNRRIEIMLIDKNLAGELSRPADQ